MSYEQHSNVIIIKFNSVVIYHFFSLDIWRYKLVLVNFWPQVKLHDVLNLAFNLILKIGVGQ